MKLPLAKLGLPLLAKELTEQAVRKRTYVVRVVYASLLFFAAYLLFYDTLRFAQASPMAALGRGRQMFEILVGLQFAGIYLFAPALTCGTITQEKERASLQLLFLTRLGPWTILFEKLLSRLIPIVGFVMLSLPLLAFAYSLGGISPQYLAGGVWLLLISALQVAALGLACSSYFRTTAAAFVATYLIGVAMFFGPVATCEVAGIHGGWMRNDLIRYPFYGAAQFFDNRLTSPPPGATTSPVALLFTVVVLLLQSAPILFSTAVCLAAARFYLVRRAFAPPRNIILNFFGRLDRLFQRWNENRWTKGIVLIGDKGSLPDDQPIAWRETTKRSLGRARYLIRLFLVLEVPLLFLCLMLVSVALESNGDFISHVIFFLWGIAVLMVSVQSASLIAGEKSRQTLDVLCTTPLTSRDIIHQKIRGVWRLMAVVSIPLLTLFCFQTWGKSVNSTWDWRVRDGRTHGPAFYLISSVITAAIYLPMVAWLSLWIGLKAKSQGRAIIGALAAIVGWCVLPFFFCIAPVAYLTQGLQDFAIVLISSPLAMIALNEFGGPPVIFRTPIPLIVNSLIYGGALVFFRRRCLRNADRLLGRASDQAEPGRNRRPAPADSTEFSIASNPANLSEEVEIAES